MLCDPYFICWAEEARLTGPRRTALWLRTLKLRTFHAGVVLGFFTSYLLPSVQSVFFERLEAFVVCAGMVRGPEFRLSVKILRRRQTALRRLAAACPQATTASSLFPLFRGEAETLRPRNLSVPRQGFKRDLPASLP